MPSSVAIGVQDATWVKVEMTSPEPVVHWSTNRLPGATAWAVVTSTECPSSRSTTAS